MAATRKAIIIGAGPCGLSAALRMQHVARIDCTVYELRPEPTTLGGAIGILSNGLRLLDRLGVYEKLRTQGNSSSRVTMHSAQGSILGVQEDQASYGRKMTGFGYMRIKRTDLMDTLIDEVQKAKIPIVFDKRLVAIKEIADGVEVAFADGTSATADVLLGCDGIHSEVRRLYVDPHQEPIYTGFAGLMSVIPISNMPQSAAAQISGFDVTMTEDGIFIMMHCTAAKDEIYWGFSREMPKPTSIESRDGWEVRRKQEVDEFKDNLHKILQNTHGEWSMTMKCLVDCTDSVKSYPVFKLPVGGTWTRGKCILLGDAAHAMPPHAGQGVAMGLEDAFLLARLLQDPHRSTKDAFQRFEKIRRPRVDELHALASKNADMRKKTGPWGLWAKERALKAGLWGAWALGLEKWGYGQHHLVYDIDEVEI